MEWKFSHREIHTFCEILSISINNHAVYSPNNQQDSREDDKTNGELKCCATSLKVKKQNKVKILQVNSILFKLLETTQQTRNKTWVEWTHSAIFQFSIFI
jgi:hypothetical protein